MENTLKKIDGTLKTLAGALAILSGSTYAGFIPAEAAIVLGFVAGICAFLAGSPLLDPTQIGKSPWVSRLFLTLGGLSAAAAGSTFFPQVQALFAEGTAHKIATGVMLFGAVCTFLAQSPVIAGGSAGPGGAAKVAMLAVFGLALSVSGCAHITAIENDIKSCVAADAPQAVKDVEAAAIPFLEKAFVCEADSGFSSAAIPPCLAASFAGVAAQIGPDAQRFETCVVTTVENDPAAAEPVKQKARLMHVKLALGR